MSALPAHAFTPETAPRQGGKKGRTWKRVDTRIREEAERMFNEHMNDILGTASENVQTAIRAGDARMSAWFIEQYQKHRGTRLETPLVDALEHIDDVEMVSKEAVLSAIQGDMSFEQLKFVQEALARHAGLKGMIELRKLREEIAELKKPSAATLINEGDLPVWGRLKEITKTAEKANGNVVKMNGKPKK